MAEKTINPAMAELPTGGVVIAAPASGSGKTVFTLALLRVLSRMGVQVAPLKLGPDYIDPVFHTAAYGRESLNIDPWAMPLHMQASIMPTVPVVAEAMMGLFDGSANGSGSAADFAAAHHLPIIMVVDCARQSHSVAALVHGFSTFRPDISIAALVLNRVGSNRHESMLREALAESGIPVIASIPRVDELKLPERHLGLVQAGEHKSLENFINSAADVLKPRLDVVLLKGLLQSSPKQKMAEPRNTVPLQPFGQRIAVAKDGAFSFIYPHVLQGWRDAGAELSFFSPLADETPNPACDAVFLPGGYPELHAANLANAQTFRRGMMEAAKRARIYGECGGFMVLGDALIDAEGSSHEMLGLLPVATSFATRKLHLGYRIVDVSANSPLWPGAHFAAHEFHYTTQISELSDEPFATEVSDARGSALGPVGAVNGSVAGSYLHLICERQHD